MKRRSVYLDAPGRVSVHEETLPEIAPGQVLVKTLLSAVSSGSELLFYRGEAPEDLPVDATIPALNHPLAYPLKYGYAAVGRVVDTGQLVFAFNPHEDYFLAAPDELVPIPDAVPAEQAVFLANLQTALNFLVDGRPKAGESVAVLGQGVPGLLTTALLAEQGLKKLVTFDRHELRRTHSLKLGAHASLDPDGHGAWLKFDELIGKRRPEEGADLVFELSGNPEALNRALACAACAGRVVIGSWYGRKPVSLELGGRFHRSRLRMINSQVSSLCAKINSSMADCLKLCLGKAGELDLPGLISHRFPVARAAAAYELLDERPGEALQVVFTYE